VAQDERSARELWDELSRLRASRLVLRALPETGAAGAAAQALGKADYRVLSERGPLSPFLELPSEFDMLLAGRSANLRGQLGRRRRALERQGRLTFRTASGSHGLQRDLDTTFRVEAAGWKTRSGTAILNQPRTQQLYREFAAAAAANGWLRLHLLELDGMAIAADFGCAYGGGECLLKTGFDERWARFSPGLVLRAEVLRSAIEEGLAFYDFLGPSDAYKLRWTDEIRPRVTLRAFRSVQALPAFAYRRRLRPLLKRVQAQVATRRRATGERANA
jgi:CelD/BcsL family acetyltransferase involved in cellulose biosynthesis